MKEKIKSIFMTLHPWQIVLLSMVGAVFITNLITALISLWLWHEIQPTLMVLGTINASLVPLIIMPIILRILRKMVKLEEQDQINKKTILQLEEQSQIEESMQRHAGEISLLYQLGILLASGKNLHETLLKNTAGCGRRILSAGPVRWQAPADPDRRMIRALYF